MTVEIKIPSKLKCFFKPKKFKVAYGGRGGAKSMSIADIILARVMSEGAKVSAMREHMNSIDDSVHSLFKSEIYRLGLEGFTIHNTSISHVSGGEITYKGISRNPESIKSMHDFDIFWVEEAATLSKRSLDLLVPTLRKEKSELWLSFNPESSEDPISQEFIMPFKEHLDRSDFYEDELYTIVKVNYYDNPFFPENLEKLRQQHYETKPRNEYDHIWLGEFSDHVENALVLPEWFDAAVNLCDKLGIKPTGATVATFDPADEGEDSKAYAVRTGIHYHDVGEIEAKDGNDACDEACLIARRHQADLFVWDGDGMGALLRRQVADSFGGVKCDLRMYKGSGSVDAPDAIYDGAWKEGQKTNKQMFYNLRAQRYTTLAQRFYNAYRAVIKREYVDPDQLISISGDIKLLQKLRAEICRIPRKPNGTGKIQLMSKQEMKNRYGIASPGMADCLAMGEEKPDLFAVAKPINFESLWD